VKADWREPVLYLVVYAGLMGWRSWHARARPARTQAMQA
jgi:DMSO/TMAO reductase YedYZ heme-binding membrane subunit